MVGNEQLQDREALEQIAAAIIDSSDDAIISKDLNGVIKTWNRGAERLFGYSADEAIGKSVTLLIPPERHDEEPEILGRIIKGERIEHYETVRQCKNGDRVEVSLTVSPVYDASGTIIGASKISRNITELKRGRDQQALLLKEMSHRIKNLFALASGVVSLSARSADTVDEFAEAVQARLGALARAHALTLPNSTEGKAHRRAGLQALATTILSPYTRMGDQIAVDGPYVRCGPRAATAFALLLHEFATNSVKYGALSQPDGRISMNWSADSEQLDLVWNEEGAPIRTGPITKEGFGSLLVRATIQGLDGTISRHWTHGGLTLCLTAPLRRLVD